MRVIYYIYISYHIYMAYYILHLHFISHILGILHITSTFHNSYYVYITSQTSTCTCFLCESCLLISRGSWLQHHMWVMTSQTSHRHVMVHVDVMSWLKHEVSWLTCVSHVCVMTSQTSHRHAPAFSCDVSHLPAFSCNATCHDTWHMPWHMTHAMRHDTCYETWHMPWHMTHAMRHDTCLSERLSPTRLKPHGIANFPSLSTG